jgi:hypothetical protein
MRRPVEQQMMTTVQRITYDWTTRTGRVDMPAYCCVDMSGCVAFFEALDPEVGCIETFAGPLPDTYYVRTGRRWTAVNTRPTTTG